MRAKLAKTLRRMSSRRLASAWGRWLDFARDTRKLRQVAAKVWSRGEGGRQLERTLICKYCCAAFETFDRMERLTYECIFLPVFSSALW